MKKLFGLLFVAGILAISACGSGAKDEAKKTDSLATPAVDTTAHVADTAAAPVK
ncbi:MAG: hypothetical protein NTZ33_10765 [Bacteroidetes bacterium]|nr:hypothetical protein [Bacteroidota bacterium]